jgi:hypothetical protein
VAPELETSLADSASVEVRYHGGAELVPQQTRPLPGDPTRGLRLLDWRLDHGRYIATVEGSGEQRLRVRSGLDLRVIEGGRRVERNGEFLTIGVSLGPDSPRRAVVLAE